MHKEPTACAFIQLPGGSQQQPAATVLGITVTCRQIHCETELMIFDLNEFGGSHIWDEVVFSNFINALGQRPRAAIKRWWVRACHLQCLESFDIPISKLEALETVIIQNRTPSYGSTLDDQERIKELIETQAGRKLSISFEL
jgi:hypothetical protein